MFCIILQNEIRISFPNPPIAKGSRKKSNFINGSAIKRGGAGVKGLPWRKYIFFVLFFKFVEKVWLPGTAIKKKIFFAASLPNIVNASLLEIFYRDIRFHSFISSLIIIFLFKCMPSPQAVEYIEGAFNVLIISRVVDTF